MSATLTVASFICAIFFPWPLTVVVALAATYYEPLVPLAVGIFADALYFVPGTGVPLASLLGLAGTAAAYLLRSRFQMR